MLGLDVKRIIRKVQLKEEDDLLKQQEVNLSKDPVMHALLLGSERIEDIDLRLIDMKQQIDKLQQDIRHFVIAEDYGEIKVQADAIAQSLHLWRNTATKCSIALGNIKKSLDRKPDIKKQHLVRFFEEANVSLGEMVIKKLEEVESFNEKLLNDRSRILLKQQEEYTSRLNEAEQNIKKLEAEENEKYLDNIDDLVRHHMEFFHDLAKSFYSDKRAGLQITNNVGINKQRFDINARISDDTGDGVNETKIFCFDWTLLSAKQNNSVRFLVHDNRILSETDPRQIATMFRNADKICRDNGFQYILTQLRRPCLVCLALLTHAHPQNYQPG